ncbi:MAG: ABC transporter permease [Clostridiales bacterium]|nr:ABC transporter permease [Clostridiales bacterium]
MRKLSKVWWFNIATTALAITISLLIAFMIIFMVSDQPLDAVNSLLFGPLSSLRNFGTVIETMITISFTGMAVCVMFQGGQFNLGAEGAFFIGAITASAITTKLSLHPGMLMFVAIVGGGLAGMLLCYIPAILRAKFNADEMVSSLMLNYVALYLGLYLLNTFLRDPNFGMLASYKIPPDAKLTQFIPKTRIHTGVFIVAILIFLIYIFIYRTRTGYSIRVLGNNPNFAHYSGIKVGSAIVISQVVGGAIAGIGGSVELLGMYERFQWTSLPGYGWDGVIIAILARNKPQYVPIAALFLSYLRIGSSIMARLTDVPYELIIVIQSIMIVLITASALLGRLRHKMVVKEAIAHGQSI